MDKYTYEEPVQSPKSDPPGTPNTKKSRKLRKSPERIAREKEFTALYEALMHPSEPLSAFRRQQLLGDLYILLFQLNRDWACDKANRYLSAGFLEADGEFGLSKGCDAAYQLLKEDLDTGNYRTSPVAFYQRVTRNKTIDLYFRSNFGRLPAEKKDDPDHPQKEKKEKKPPKRKQPYQVSLDELSQDENGIYHDDRNPALACDPFGDTRRPRWEIARKAHQLSILLLRELMDYPYEPQKPLALMYGNILYQLARESDGTDELTSLARESTKISSPPWAHRAMGDLTLEQLGDLSERIVGQYYEADLAWGTPFREHMPQPADAGSGVTWREVVYTKSYTVGNTSNWIESIQKSTLEKCAKRLIADPQLLEFAEDSFEPMDKLMRYVNKIKQKKEVSR